MVQHSDARHQTPAPRHGSSACRLKVTRRSAGLTKQQEADLTQFFIDSKDTGYTLDAWTVLYGLRNPPPLLESMYCSQAAGAAFQAAGVLKKPPHGKPPHKYAPGDFTEHRCAGARARAVPCAPGVTGRCGRSGMDWMPCFARCLWDCQDWWRPELEMEGDQYWEPVTRIEWPYRPKEKKTA